MNEEQPREEIQYVPGAPAVQQNAEFLKYLLDTDDPITNLRMQLNGQGVHYVEGKPSIVQVSPPLVNLSLSNKIFTIIQTYSTRGFITTILDDKEINLIVMDVSHAVIDLIESSKSYPSSSWRKHKAYLRDYPAFMQGTNQQILLMIEHTVYTTLKRSKAGVTLDKVTGMHSSQEIKNDQQPKTGGIFGVFKR